MYSKLSLLCICFLFCQNSYAAEPKQNSESELQILIDVSGSMKDTDPNNLRIPAVKLLINLLPDGSKAGIWLFAQNTEVLVETGIVNEQWKNKALEKLKEIHSQGLFTNIEDAIQTSAQSWFNSSSEQQRNMILLTDGMVDISKDIMQSAESRERIMVDQVPLLQQAGAKLYTIALSENADAELLNKLALDTNGWSETAQSAAQLQRIFFKMFKKAVPQDILPLKDNAFMVDASIKEFSVLVFKAVDAPATQLVSPENVIISNADHVDNVSWLNENNYDLVTIKKPDTGEWKIVAEMDPDNQVMIVTDLKLQLDDFPNYISVNESFDLRAYFTDQQQLISREDFLSLIDISIQQVDDQGRKNEWKMMPVEDKAGFFSKTIEPLLGKGIHTITVLADGQTFERERVLSIEVVGSPVVVETDINQSERTVRLTLVTDQTIINTEMMTIQATITQSGKDAEVQNVDENEGRWELVVDAPAEGESKTISFSIMAKTVQGSSILPDVKPVVIDDSLFSKVVPESVSDLDEEKKDEENKPEEKTAEEVIQEQSNDQTKDTVEEKKPVNWIKTSVIVVGINIVLIIVFFLLYKFIKKKAVDKQAQLLERLA